MKTKTRFISEIGNDGRYIEYEKTVKAGKKGMPTTRIELCTKDPEGQKFRAWMRLFCGFFCGFFVVSSFFRCCETDERKLLSEHVCRMRSSGSLAQLYS